MSNGSLFTSILRDRSLVAPWGLVFDRKIPEMSDLDGPSEVAAQLRCDAFAARLRTESIDLCVLAPGFEF